VSEICVFEGKVPEDGFPFYAWYVGKDDDKKNSRQYFFACVTDEAFYLSRPLESSAKRIAESNRLQQEQPVDVFRTGQTVYFQAIGEVRCSKSGDRLELVREDGQSVLGIDDGYSQQCRKMFDDIRRRRAPRMPVEEGGLSAWHSLGPPLGATGAALVVGFRMSEPAFKARTVAFWGVAVGVCLGWLVYRWFNPVSCDVVRLERR